MNEQPHTKRPIADLEREVVTYLLRAGPSSLDAILRDTSLSVHQFRRVLRLARGSDSAKTMGNYTIVCNRGTYQHTTRFHAINEYLETRIQGMLTMLTHLVHTTSVVIRSPEERESLREAAANLQDIFMHIVNSFHSELEAAMSDTQVSTQGGFA